MNLKKEENHSYIVKLGELFVCNTKLNESKIKSIEMHYSEFYAEEYKDLKSAINISEQIGGKILNKVEFITKSYKYEEVIFF